MAGEIIARDAEVSVVRAFLDRPGEGTTALVLKGDAGIGKSTLSGATRAAWTWSSSSPGRFPSGPRRGSTSPTRGLRVLTVGSDATSVDPESTNHHTGEATARRGKRAVASGSSNAQAATPAVASSSTSSSSSVVSGSNDDSAIGSVAGASPSASAWAVSESAACCAS